MPNANCAHITITCLMMKTRDFYNVRPRFGFKINLRIPNRRKYVGSWGNEEETNGKRGEGAKKN